MSTTSRLSTPACCTPIVDEAMEEADAARAAELFKALGDPTRVRIVNLLATSAEPVCVCDITPVVALSQPTVSFHLKKLLGAGLVEREQRGKWAYYSIRQGALAELAAVLLAEGART
jgi:ArsR family transcriptional regulator